MTHADTAVPLPPVIAPAELVELLHLRPGIRLLDVRTPGEYETAHIRGSYNVPLDQLGEHRGEIRSAVAEPVILVCQSGQRAVKAESALAAAGMPNLHVLDGGMNAWLADGRPVVRGARRISLERQVRIGAGALVAIGSLLALTIDTAFALIPAFVGSGLIFAGVSDICAMGMLLAKLPYNRPATCDVGAMVSALTAHANPATARASVPATSGGRACC